MPMIPTDGFNQAESGFFRDIYFAIDLFYTSGGRDDSLPPSVLWSRPGVTVLKKTEILYFFPSQGRDARPIGKE